MPLLAQISGGTAGTVGSIDIELLKLLAAVLALIVSTGTIQFKLAEFINDKRDNFPTRRVGKWSTVGEFYDWLWGYGLGIAVNALFVCIASYLVAELEAKNLDSIVFIGKAVYWGYIGNMVFWVVGFILDLVRLCNPGTVRR